MRDSATVGLWAAVNSMGVSLRGATGLRLRGDETYTPAMKNKVRNGIASNQRRLDEATNFLSAGPPPLEAKLACVFRRKPFSLSAAVMVFALSWAAPAQDLEQLFRAIGDDRPQSVRQLLDQYPTLSKAQDKRGYSALYRAAYMKRPELVRLLIERGADVNLGTARGTRPLHASAENGSLEITNVLLEHGADPLLRDGGGRTPLHWAAHTGNVEMINRLLAAKAPLEATDAYGATPLHMASLAGRAAAVDRLLLGNPPVDRPDNSGRTALFMCLQGHHGEWNKVAASLVSHGADVNLAGRGRAYPLLTAARNPSKETLETVTLLLSKGADPKATDSQGRSALHWAARTGSLEVVTALLKAGCEIEARDRDGSTPLGMAAATGRAANCEKLLGSGAQPDGGTPTPLDLCLRGRAGEWEKIAVALLNKDANSNQNLSNGSFPIVEAGKYSSSPVLTALLTKNADVKAVDSQGNTSLHWSAQNGAADLVDALMKAGAPLEAADGNGQTPLHRAAAAGRATVVEKLLKAGAHKEVVDSQGRTPLQLCEEFKQGEWQKVQPLLK